LTWIQPLPGLVAAFDFKRRLDRLASGAGESDFDLDEIAAGIRRLASTQPAEENPMCECAQSAETVLDPLPHPMMVDIQSGDVLVVHSDRRGGKERLEAQLADITPGAKVLFVDDGNLLTHILRPTA
jgi:hypothetical protein